MASSSSTRNFEVRVLLAKGKRAAAAYVHADVVSPSSPNHLQYVLDNLLNPVKAINEWETIDWCKWLMAGGRTPDEFSSIVRLYDNATTCGLVWTPNFVAYRCRTCGISPCMSLCTECFKKGNHKTHDFNMFLSQAGGACDCGDTSVMKEAGFCDRHGPNKSVPNVKAPSDLMAVAEAMMPRIIFRLIQHLRENSSTATHSDGFKAAIGDADAYITMLVDFNNMGGLMRKVMTGALTNPQMYKNLNVVPVHDHAYASYMIDSHRVYQEALKAMPNPEPSDEYKDVPSLQEHLKHQTLLEELVFWTVRYEFPQKLVCLLLNMLPDMDYKEGLTRAFVLHYSRISLMLERSQDPDTLSNRVVHVSVQLFSNLGLALKMAESMSLLHVMVVSLKYMMSKILIQNTLHGNITDPDKNFHYVVDCAKPVMKEHCYWPLVSDLNNVLSHRPVALKFMADDALLEMWFTFISMFQGMNVNQRELKQHVEFEPNTYYAAFSAELEASAYPMWALVSHLTDRSTSVLTCRVLHACHSALMEWLDAVNFTSPDTDDSYQVSFHLPLHRFFSIFLCQAISKQGATLNEVLPNNDTLQILMMHPLRVQVAFYEILNGLWVRNGLQIKGQAMTYIQCNFCNSMVDADLYLLQLCAMRLPSDQFLSTVLKKFHVKEWMSLAPYHTPQNVFLDAVEDTPMLESFLTFLGTLVSLRINLGLSDTDHNRLEMVTLLCMGDKTHSQLMELMPERCGTTQCRDFETILAEVGGYKPPCLDLTGQLQQGMYYPKSIVWEKYFDPFHVLLRAVHRRDFQTSMDRYTEYVRQAGLIAPSVCPWPPSRDVPPVGPAYEDPRIILRSRVFHAIAFVVLYKATKNIVSEHVMCLIIYLLEQAVVISENSNDESSGIRPSGTRSPRLLNDMDLANWFATDSLTENLRTTIGRVVLTPEPEVSPITYSSDSELEWDGSELDPEITDLEALPSNVLMLEEGEWNSAPSNDLMLFVPRPIEQQDSPSYEELALPGPSTQVVAPSGVLALPSTSSVVEETEDAEMTLAVAPNMSMVQANSIESPTEAIAQPALPSTPQHPAVLAGSEVGRPPANWPPRFSPSDTHLVPSSSSTRKPYQMRRRQTVESSSSNPPTVKINESIITLLLKLHSQLSGIPDSYRPEDSHNPPHEPNASAPPKSADVGDGPFYISKLLNKISELDTACKEHILRSREKLWPRQKEREAAQKEKEKLEREERRRKAKERQQKLIDDFARKQKQFLEQAMEEDQPSSSGDDSSRLRGNEYYDCVICNVCSPSTEAVPMGLVVFVQATSVLGHRRRQTQPERDPLPTCDIDRDVLRSHETLAKEFDKRVEELDRHFDPPSWLLSVNIGWEGGVSVATCGHHMHLDCLKSYLGSLKGNQRQQSLAPDKGEFLCPLCRQLANSVLPLSPQLGDCTTQIVKSRPDSMGQVLLEVSDLLRENEELPKTSGLSEAMGKCMEDMTSSTTLKPMFKPKSDNKPSAQSLFLFVTSIARTNLEIELVQRGGSLVCSNVDNPLLPIRDCILPLLHVLAVHARVLAVWPTWMTFQQLCGLPAVPPENTLAPIDREVPLLLRDPTALLLQFILLLPLHLDQIYFTTVIKMVYNLLYYQVVVAISCDMSPQERREIVKEASNTHVQSLSDALSLINEVLGHTDLYTEDDGAGCSSSPQVSIVALEQQVQKQLLPFLRVAALLRHHIFDQALPDIRSPQSEFVRLVYYLELVTEGMDWGCFNAAVALNWPSDTDPTVHRVTPQIWCNQFAAFVCKSQIAARSFLVDQHISWHQPRLLDLPREYERIFTYYHERPCSQCHSVPQEASVCLLCGTIVCLKQNCCKQQSVCEAVAHANECGAGTGIFLVVTSTYIIVIRGRRACLWGSLYLDEFEEEDRDLKRGKPLYLSKARYQLLEKQWLAHRFDHTKKTWVWHRDAL